jgi:hypothetical protein
MNEQERVLLRRGARELTVEEIDSVSAAMQAHTNVCSVITATSTGSGDGDGCTDTDHDFTA